MLKELAVLVMVGAVRAEMEGYIVGGSQASITDYPHSAFLSVACLSQKQTTSHWICGSSIINQMLLLTAGHCVYNCYAGTSIVINFGSSTKKQGVTRSSNTFVLHKNYTPSTTVADIAMVLLQTPISFSDNINRVALMKFPPYNEPALIAGWGLVDERLKIQSPTLKQVGQRLWSFDECQLFFEGHLPVGTICARAANQNEYPSMGDSGSALVVRGYIQIGLVSFKVPSTSATVIIYTDVGYYYSWIQNNAERLFCTKKSLNNKKL